MVLRLKVTQSSSTSLRAELSMANPNVLSLDSERVSEPTVFDDLYDAARCFGDWRWPVK